MPTCGYHCTAKIISRKAGQSAIAKAAYNARENLRDEQTGEWKRHDHRDGVTFSGIFAPKDAPEWALDRQQLWNKVEQVENRKNSRLARELEVAFPHQLDQQQREWLVKDFAREQFARKDLIADVNIHAPHPDRDERNWHAHILFTVRKLDGDEFAKHKAEHGPTMSRGDWREAETAQLEAWREKWAEMGARALERAGHQIEADRWRHGHRDLPEQREEALKRGDHEYAEAVNREATKHRGPQVDAMQRKGMETERGNAYRDTITRNETLDDLRRKAAEVALEIAKAEREYTAERRQRAGLPEDLRGSRAEIWEARYYSDNAQSFRAALDEQKISIAQVTKAEAAEYRQNSEHFEKLGHYVPRLREGEFVAVGKFGQVYRFNPATTGREFKETQQFLQSLGPGSTPGVIHTQAAKHEALEQQRQQRNAEFEREREQQTSIRNLRKGGSGQAGMVQQQEWAAQEAKRRNEENARQQKQEMRDAQAVDIGRFRTDPDYRRELMTQNLQRFAERSNEERREQIRQFKEVREFIQTRQR